MSTNRGEALGLLQERDDLLKLLFGFSHTSDVVEHHAGFRFHHEAGFAFAELHGLTRTTRHAAIATSQKNQCSDQQQWEEQIAKQAKGRWRCLRWVDIEADALFFQGVDQFRSETR